MNQQNILIDLDALLDTRIGTLICNAPEIVESLDFKQYHLRENTRVWEVFGVTEDVWSGWWKARDVNTLMASSPTGLVKTMRVLLAPAVVRGVTEPVYDKVNVTINIYPYRLDDSLQTAIIDEFKDNCLWPDCQTEIVRVPPRALTPQYIKPRWQNIIMYDYPGWLALQVEALQSFQIPTVVISAPGFLDNDTEELREIAKSEQVNPYDDHKRTMAHYITIVFLDRLLFSLPL